MIFLIANWVLLIPVASGLAISLVLSSDLVERPADSWLRLALRISVWTMLVLALLGFCLRATPLHIFWMIVLLAFTTVCFIWNYALARNTLMLVVLATRGNLQRLIGVTHYLVIEGRGVWLRKGRQLMTALTRSEHWSAAALQAGLARETPVELALRLAEQHTAGIPTVREMLAESTSQRLVFIRMTNRLVAASLSLLALAAIGTGITVLIMPSMWKISAEFAQPIDPSHQWHKVFIDWQVHIWLPLLCWLVVGFLLALLVFPRMSRHVPFVWLNLGYYRALALQALACMLQVNSRASVACRAVATALPIPYWSRRLMLAANAIDAGLPAPQALAKHRILSEDEARVLSLAKPSESWAWTLEQISRSLRERALAKLDLSSQLASVALILISAMMVALLATTILGTLTNLVTHSVP